MPYYSNIPQSTDYINDSQSQILANFTALAPWGNGYGQFTLQGTAPTFAAGVNGIYTLLNATTTANELYIHLQRIGAANAPADIPFTASKMSNTAMANCDSGWSYLPSGLLIKWGVRAISTASTYTAVDVSTISGGPNFNRAFQVIVSGYNSSTYLSFNATWTGLNTTTGNFNAALSAANAFTSVAYLVIGV